MNSKLLLKTVFLMLELVYGKDKDRGVSALIAVTAASAQ